MDFKKYSSWMVCLFAALGIVLLAIGIVVRGDNLYTGITYVVVGIFQLLIALSAIPRLRGKDGAAMGNVVVQHNWWILSVGIAGLAVFPSQFFSLPLAGLVYLAVAISAIWVILGAINVYLAVKRTGARLAV